MNVSFKSYSFMDFGNENKNSIPPSFVFRTEISPLCNTTAFLTIAKPRPVPPNFLDLPVSIR